MKKKLGLIVLIFSLLFAVVPSVISADPPPLELVKTGVHAVIQTPRPHAGAVNVPLKSSFYIELNVDDPEDTIRPLSVSVELQPAGGAAYKILNPYLAYATGYSGTMTPSADGHKLGIFIDTTVALLPNKVYTIRVTATSVNGSTLPSIDGTWTFTTEPAVSTNSLSFNVNTTGAPTVYTGGFFNGAVVTSWSNAASKAGFHELAENARVEYPDAWTVQRDAYLSGFGHERTNLDFKKYPKIVRELQTREVTSIAASGSTYNITVQDFIGHGQYCDATALTNCIASNRPLTTDYQVGNIVSIGDGEIFRTAVVNSVNNTTKVVNVTSQSGAIEGFDLIATSVTHADAPGTFPNGGTYLRKHNPVGTPKYYWGRLDHQWDEMVTNLGMNVVPRFSDAPGDISLTGQDGTTTKNYLQLHNVVRDITTHIINRYGVNTLDWHWTILNEPDLASYAWKVNDWVELQKFYDIVSNAILLAFQISPQNFTENQINAIRIGGLELGATQGLNIKVDDFLRHVSPNHSGSSATLLDKNFVCEQSMFNYKRSDRVKAICNANANNGAPFDFLSVHTYNYSSMAANKLIKAKERALAIDATYFADLPIGSYETVPTWQGIKDPGASDMYLGNGYFESWGADFISRLVHKASTDARYGDGDTLFLTTWPWINSNFGSLNDVVREIKLADRTEVIPSPMFHLVNKLTTLSDNFYVLPQQTVKGHTVSGLLSNVPTGANLFIYAHNEQDTQSRSEQEFEIDITTVGIQHYWFNKVQVKQYRFDSTHNSYMALAKILRQKAGTPQIYTESEYNQALAASALQVTSTQIVNLTAGNSTTSFTANVSGNGVNFIEITPYLGP